MPNTRLASWSAVGTVELGDMDDGQHHALRVPERQAGPGTELGRLFLGDIEGDRHGPDRAVGKPHPVADGLVVVLAEEAPQRREAAVGQQLEVAESGGERSQEGQSARLLLQLGCPVGG